MYNIFVIRSAVIIFALKIVSLRRDNKRVTCVIVINNFFIYFSFSKPLRKAIVVLLHWAVIFSFVATSHNNNNSNNNNDNDNNNRLINFQ